MSESDFRMQALERIDTPFKAGDSNLRVTLASMRNIVDRLAAERTDDTANTHQDNPVTIAARVILKRNAGKIVFATVRSVDRDGAVLQVLLAPQTMEPEQIALFKENVHIGDVLYISGYPGYSSTNELTLMVTEFTMAAKALNAIPKAAKNPETNEFEHALNKETVHEHPVLHLLTSPEHRNRMVVRSRIVRAIRTYFEAQGFLEVDTPVLSSHAGGAAAEKFSTDSRARGQELFLRIAPELYLKRLVIGGMGNVFEIGKNFRNEGVDRTHSPEFMALESYMLHSDYMEQLQLTIGLIQHICGENESPVDSVAIVRFFDVLNGHLPEGVTIEPTDSAEQVTAVAQSVGVEVKGTAAEQMEDLFDALVVPEFGSAAVAVVDYPTGTTPLAYPNGDGTSQKWDLYLGGMEVATAYTENTDPLVQAESLPNDQDFVNDVMYGMPPMGGLGIGIDRLIMILLGVEHINAVNHHPHSAV